MGWPEHPETTVTGFAPATVTLPWAQTVPAPVPPLSPPAGHLASELAMQMAAGDLRPQTGPRQPRGPQGHASRLLPGETLRCPPTSSPWWETPGVLGSVRPAHRLLPLFAAFGALHAGRGDTEECGSGRQRSVHGRWAASPFSYVVSRAAVTAGAQSSVADPPFDSLGRTPDRGGAGSSGGSVFNTFRKCGQSRAAAAPCDIPLAFLGLPSGYLEQCQGLRAEFKPAPCPPLPAPHTGVHTAMRPVPPLKGGVKFISWWGRGWGLHGSCSVPPLSCHCWMATQPHVRQWTAPRGKPCELA